MFGLLFVCAVVLIFGFVVFFGAPYLPTLRKQSEDALDMLNLKPGQTLLELGSGDGRVMLAAARRGLNVVGIELNPVLCIIARAVTWRYRRQVKVICGNFWQVKWPPADGMFVFLLTKYMPRLDKKITQYARSKVKVISYAFPIPGRKLQQQHEALFLYEYDGKSGRTH